MTTAARIAPRIAPPNPSNRRGAILKYTNASVLAALMSRFGIDDRAATELLGDVTKFLYMYSAAPFTTAWPPSRIYEAWATFRKCEDAYLRFCMDNFGVYLDRPSKRVRRRAADAGITHESTCAVVRSSMGDLGANWELTSADVVRTSLDEMLDQFKPSPN